MKRNSFTLAFVAVLALACGAAFAGYPATNYLPAEVLVALGALGGMPMAMSGEVTLIEVKKILEDQGKAWEEHKKANDELIKATLLTKDGAVVHPNFKKG